MRIGLLIAIALTPVVMLGCLSERATGTSGAPFSALVPVKVAGQIKFSSISAGYTQTCAVTAAGAAYCWGDNAMGEVGDGSEIRRWTPTAVAGGLAFKSITAGYYQTCGLTTGGDAYCWGDVIGDRLFTTSLNKVPTLIGGGLKFTAITLGGTLGGACGLTATGAAYCWGDNFGSVLGDSTATAHPTPVSVASSYSFSSLSAGGIHFCGLASSGQAICWGLNTYGQLGNGSTNSSAAAPSAVTGGHVFTALSAGKQHTCGVTNGGTTYCWGWNLLGTLGDSTTTDRSSPVPGGWGQKLSTITSGSNFSCGLTSGGAGFCWGDYGSGKLGFRPSSALNFPYLRGLVEGGLTFVAISAGSDHTCGLTADGTAYCWGSNIYAQLGVAAP